MNAKFSYTHFEWSFCAIYHYFHNQNISFVEQGAWKKWHFCSMGLSGTPLCACCFCVLYFNVMHWSAIGLLTKNATFFSWPYFINSVISQYSGKYYGQWITTQNKRKKILHAFNFKLTIWIKYFLSYITKCQTGTYFFGCVYFSTKREFPWPNDVNTILRTELLIDDMCHLCDSVFCEGIIPGNLL